MCAQSAEPVGLCAALRRNAAEVCAHSEETAPEENSSSPLPACAKGREGRRRGKKRYQGKLRVQEEGVWSKKREKNMCVNVDEVITKDNEKEKEQKKK